MSAYTSSVVTGLIEGDVSTKRDLTYQHSAVGTTVDEQFELLTEAAVTAEQLGNTDLVQKLRGSVEKLAGAFSQVHARTQALRALKASYQCTEAATDFEARLRAPASAVAAAAADCEKRLKDLDRAVWNVHHQGQPMPGEDEDDLWIDSTQQELAPNPRCPLSFVALLDLKEPVKDSKGYVYEKNAILGYIKARGRNGVADSPNAGASYTISAADIVPAHNVLRAKKRKATQARASTDGAPDAVEIDGDDD